MRINLYAGPGAGKSTTAAWLFSELKTRRENIELVTEYVKGWAIGGRAVTGFDQVYLMGKQMQYEYRFIKGGVKNIVTDSPVLLSAAYARMYAGDLNIADSMEKIIDSYESLHPCINIYLKRSRTREYDSFGRYQDEREAQRIDGIVCSTLDRLNYKYTQFDFEDRENLLNFVLANIDK